MKNWTVLIEVDEILLEKKKNSKMGADTAEMSDKAYIETILNIRTAGTPISVYTVIEGHPQTDNYE